ncbi:hypothetical protein GC096_09955 [Paenibacillus sp. LMG 31461]|uniref:Uncharacterized protein n=1 Tax=Paenibacillus plantarum TaxID=2654975 RepID=A0ABX1X7R6_9BACL|nr:hypothetical protein [Paenibacillus plantarum]
MLRGRQLGLVRPHIALKASRVSQVSRISPVSPVSPVSRVSPVSQLLRLRRVPRAMGFVMFTNPSTKSLSPPQVP